MKENPNVGAFENVKGQVGFCGIWCGSCIVGNGALRELTKRYRALLDAYDLQDWAPKDFDYHEFSKGLESIQKMPFCAGCLKGGGRDDCPMRTCASDKALQSCTSCHHFGRCKNAELLEHMRSGARDAGLSVVSDDADRQQLVGQGSAELKNNWPCCILFINDR